jgi:hypothetical protein
MKTLLTLRSLGCSNACALFLFAAPLHAEVTQVQTIQFTVGTNGTLTEIRITTEVRDGPHHALHRRVWSQQLGGEGQQLLDHLWHRSHRCGHLSETSPGVYQVLLSLPALTKPTYFFRIED